MARNPFRDATNSFNNNSFNTVSYNCTVADERSQILTWLSPLEPRLRHKDIQERRVNNIGEWVLQTEEFKRWYTSSGGSESNKAVLFFYGDPGVGKTFISSLVIDGLCDRTRRKGVAVGCFYFDFAAQKEQSPVSMLGAVLKQVVRGLEEIPEEIAQAYEDEKEAIGGRGPQLPDIVKMLRTTASRKRIFICIDALDECVAGYRVKLLDSLNQILQDSPGTRILVTGRAHIRAEIEKRLTRRVTALRITLKEHDITSYLRSRLNEDTTPDAMDSSLEADILENFTEDISEMFLLVSLKIDAILRETTISRRRQKLNAMTEGLGLGGAYSETLSRIKGQGGEKSRLGIAALMWISHSERPLRVDELCHALGVEIGSPDPDPDNIPSIGTLLACCQGLVSVDEKASTVRLIHFTLQVYLRAYPEPFGRAHATIAETCLSYLNSHQIKSSLASRHFNSGLIPSPEDHSLYSDTPSLEYLPWHPSTSIPEYSSPYSGTHFQGYSSLYSDPRSLGYSSQYSGVPLLNHSSRFSGTPFLPYAPRYSSTPFLGDPPLRPSSSLEYRLSSLRSNTPFLEYSSRYWGAHARRDLSDCAKQLALKLFDDYSNHISAGILLNAEKSCSFSVFSKPFRFSGLHCASFFGIVEIVAGLVEGNDCDINQRDCTGNTPLVWAALNGHEEVVKILLGRYDVNPDRANGDDETPLSCAAKNGHGGVVEILLGRDDVTPDKPNEDGQTPLCWTAKNGHEGVLEILLGRDDVDPNKADNDRRTPLWWAAKNGHQAVVEILLRRGDVNPDKTNKYGESPLWWAAMNGHEEMVKVLLERDNVNPNKPDSDGRTPLWCAAENGREGVVKMLLGRDDVNPDQANKRGETPFWWAAMNGHEEVVKILLERDDVNPNRPDSDGRTPLSCAAKSGHEGVVKILLGCGRVDPEQPDAYGQTPLWWAVMCGHTGVIALLQPLVSTTPSTA